MTTKNILITGACGFIGSHMIEHFFKNTTHNLIVIDKLSYASNGFDRLRHANLINQPRNWEKDPSFTGKSESSRIKVFTWDLTNPISKGLQYELEDINIIIHLAAETHIDNSISDPVSVIYNNIMSTVYLLEYARTLKNLEKFFYFSTDEVFGNALGDVSYKEWDRHKPTNPYSASKSSAEQICLSYENTYKVPIIIVNVMNAFGERQHTEKFIPKVIKAVLNDELIYIHTDNKGIPGSRFYIHARNISQGILFLIEKGKIGDKYNIVGEKEMNNLEMAQFIAKVVGKELKYELVNFHSTRPGHDLRYCLNGEKMRDMGWKLPVSFEDSLTKTIKWTLQYPEWLDFSEFN